MTHKKEKRNKKEGREQRVWLIPGIFPYFCKYGTLHRYTMIHCYVTRDTYMHIIIYIYIYIYINKWMKYIYACAYIYIYMKQHTLQTRTRWGLFVINNKGEAMCIMTFKFIFYPVTIVFSYFLMNFRWQCLLFKPAGCYLYLRVYR